MTSVRDGLASSCEQGCCVRVRSPGSNLEGRRRASPRFDFRAVRGLEERLKKYEPTVEKSSYRLSARDGVRRDARSWANKVRGRERKEGLDGPDLLDLLDVLFLLDDGFYFIFF
jgi:hypothetical protein